jgi:hypothetical protein
MSVRPFCTWLLAALAPLAASACAPREPQHPQLAFASLPRLSPVPPSRPGETPAIEEPADPRATPAFRYAQLDAASCEAELTRRGIAFTPVAEARGVLAPIRLAGPVGGIAYHTALSPKDRATSPNEVFDCRLILALDDFSAILRTHDVVEVIHFSGWRPPSAKRWPAGKLGTRHDGALALDAGTFVKSDGTKLEVEKDFHGRIGAKTCGPGTGPWSPTPAAIELRDIVCEAAGEHLFTVTLTPDYNWPHRNHFHLEVTPKVKWFLVH